MTTHLTLVEEGSTGDSITLKEVKGLPGLYVEIENPWSGDTETGFGSECGFRLTKEQALELSIALRKWAIE